tara:strand:- start:2763 stop:3773 length:1011 start_codon:yes stop_codon:yes gene_type:complete
MLTNSKKLIAALMSASLLAVPMTASAGELPTNSNGFYMLATESEDMSTYERVNVLCVSPKSGGFVALQQGKGDRIHSTGSNQSGKRDRVTFNLGEADGGASQIHYALSDPETAEQVGNLHYINPGALGDPAKLPMTSFSSIELDGARAECLMAPDIVYLGVAADRKVKVTADETGVLMLTEISNETGEPMRRVPNGYWTANRGEIYFLFVDGARLTTIKALGGLDYPVWRTSAAELAKTPLDLWDSPSAFFTANMTKLGAKESMTSYGLALHFDRLVTCNHLAGETSGNAERDALVTESWKKASCDDVAPNHPIYLTEYADDYRISAALNALKPIY